MGIAVPETSALLNRKKPVNVSNNGLSVQDNQG